MKATRLAGLIIAMAIITAASLALAGAPAPTNPVLCPLPPSHKVVIPIFIRAPSILNGNFELKTTHGSCYWFDWTTGSSVPQSHCPQEVRVPSFWRAGWHNQYRDGYEPKALPAGPATGQPEMRLTHPRSDPGRARSGQALMWFTFCRRQWVWIEQPVPRALAGRLVTAHAHVQVWDSQCSTKPFSPPLDKACKTQIEDNLLVRLCFVPLHWPQGHVSKVETICTPWKTAYCFGSPCWTPLQIGPYQVQNPTRIRIEAHSRYPYKHQNVYIDDVSLETAQ